jgi:hypothetical protein
VSNIPLSSIVTIYREIQVDMQGDVLERGRKETADIPKELYQKIDLTRDTCKVRYDLACLLVATKTVLHYEGIWWS